MFFGRGLKWSQKSMCSLMSTRYNEVLASQTLNQVGGRQQDPRQEGCTLVTWLCSSYVTSYFMKAEHIKKHHQTHWWTLNGDATPPFWRQGMQFHKPLLGNFKGINVSIHQRQVVGNQFYLFVHFMAATCASQKERVEATRDKCFIFDAQQVSQWWPDEGHDVLLWQVLFGPN